LLSRYRTGPFLISAKLRGNLAPSKIKVTSPPAAATALAVLGNPPKIKIFIVGKPTSESLSSTFSKMHQCRIVAQSEQYKLTQYYRYLGHSMQ
jgi:hypothetical protein